MKKFCIMFNKLKNNFEEILENFKENFGKILRNLSTVIRNLSLIPGKFDKISVFFRSLSNSEGN